MKNLITLGLLTFGLCLGSAPAVAQATDTNSAPFVDTNAPPLFSGPAATAFEFLTTGSNYIVVPYGAMQLKEDKFGGGLAIGYRLSDYVVPFLRLDEFDGNLTMPSGTIQLQLPVRIMNAVTLTPLVYSGVGTCLAGNAANNGQISGVFGAGAAVRLGTHFDLIGAYEKRTGIASGNFVLFGVGWKPAGW